MSDQELERLRELNSQLTRQVQQLIRTEQRLHRTGRRLESQVRRIEAMNRLMLGLAEQQTSEALLSDALETLMGMYAYQQGMALLPVDTHTLRPACVAAVEGRAAHSEERLLEISCPLDPDGLPDEVTLYEGPLDSCPIMVCLQKLFTEGGPPPTWNQVLLLPLRLGGSARALLALRRTDQLRSHVEVLPDSGDLPFLHLVTGQLEAALEAAQLRMRMYTVIQHLPGALAVSRSGRIVEGNRALCSLLGLPERETLNIPLAELVLEADREHWLSSTDQVLETGRPMRLLEQRFVRADGSAVLAEVVLASVPDRFDRSLLIMAEDHTDRARMRTELLQADRLATVGALAAGVAHEINNPLTYVMGALERLERLVDADSDSGRAAKAALEGAARIQTITRDLKTFSRVDEEDTRRRVSLNELLDRVLKMAQTETTYRAKVVRDYAPDVAVLANEGRLSQVFLNLVINASQAIEEGHVAENAITVCTRVHGGEAQVEISDTGHGIAPQDLGRIFEPFVTTKDVGEGSGLGLSICRNLVKGYGGNIEVQSELGKGSSFTVRLPATGAETTEQVEAVPLQPRRQSSGNARRILLVDDEPNIRNFLTLVLEEEHHVVQAANGMEAIKRMEEDGEVDMIICDLMMPGLTGMDLHAWIRENRPTMLRRVVFMTGGTFTPRARDFVASCPNSVLEKPFSVEELERVVEQVLGL